MKSIDFSQFYYFPCLQCTEPEQLAYDELSSGDKNSILPIFEISQIKYESTLEESVISLSNLLENRPFILDLSQDRAPAAFVSKNNPDHAKIKKLQAAQDAFNKRLISLLDDADGFSNWRALVENFPAAIPTLIFTDPESQNKSILRQASKLMKSGRQQLAIRITQETSETIFETIGQIAAILDSAAQLLIIVDCGQGRQRVAERAEFAKKAIARIVADIEPAQSEKLIAVCLNDSYTNPGNALLKNYESYSWELWEQASEKFPFLFGDYGAHHRMKKTNTYMPGDWKAQVIYPLSEAWLVYRHLNSQDAQGWIDGAKAIKKDGLYDGPLDCWGSSLIENAAKGDIEGVASARFWHAAKINMHLHRQIGHAQDAIGGSEP